MQARPIPIQAQATLISLPSNHTEEKIIRKQEGIMPNCCVAVGARLGGRDVPREDGAVGDSGDSDRASHGFCERRFKTKA